MKAGHILISLLKLDFQVRHRVYYQRHYINRLPSRGHCIISVNHISNAVVWQRKALAEFSPQGPHWQLHGNLGWRIERRDLCLHGLCFSIFTIQLRSWNLEVWILWCEWEQWKPITALGLESLSYDEYSHQFKLDNLLRVGMLTYVNVALFWD